MAQAGVAGVGLKLSGVLSSTAHSQSTGRQQSDLCCKALPLWGGFAKAKPNQTSSTWEQHSWVGRGFSSAVRASRDSEGGKKREESPGGRSRYPDSLRDPSNRGAALEGEENVERSLDRIETAAKASIDKLRHIIYKLRTQAPEATSTEISTVSGDLLMGSAKFAGRDEEIFIKQDFEVELGSFGGETSGDESDSPDAEAFVHHDALTCTQTSVRIDEATGTAVVSVTATVRGGDIIDQSSYTEKSVALAARALARTCLALDEKAQAALAGGQSVLKTLPKLDRKPHELLTEVLQDGQIVRFAPLVEAGSSPFRHKYEVELEIPQWSKANAVFIPFVPGDAFLRWRRAPAEWVAYQMNLLLGLDIVPPAAIRTNVQLGEEKYDLGVMVAAVSGLRPLSSIPTRKWGVPSPVAFVTSAHVLDALLGGAPRQPHEFKAGNHWSLQGGLKPVVWEHPMGPGRGALHSMWSHRGERKGVKSIPATTLARLKELSPSVLFEQLGGAVTSDETELILERRDQIVAYFDAMAKRHGGEAVLV
ncbi:hypothetical protein KFL_000580130 [Klebsormidium nitens]|uniref:Uncharacterized protein n=1 Tax=Klebsormidium nitens TaxID=105231 RepID=A0A1Y1HTW0_KLENI|nr:hypothetical protein KFL_000580130 [Klebsormidium nitens]|eukprot:GAQ80619.1 hypothetical protein KFL_000580130 [Klebsormidium nitens]